MAKFSDRVLILAALLAGGEVLDAGFEKVGEDDFLKENYMIRFRKVGRPDAE